MGNPESIQYINAGDALGLVNKHAREMADVDAKQERGYAHLGRLLLEVSDLQLWRVRYETFREYLASVAEISKRTVPQLQRYFLTVRDLSDCFKLEELEAMGITKAMMLRAAKDYAIILPDTVVQAALDPKISSKDLKKTIGLALKMPSDDADPLDWRDFEFEGPCTDEQVKTIEDAIEAAIHTEPLIKSTLSRPAQMIEILYRLSMEYLSSHPEAIVGGHVCVEPGGCKSKDCMQ